MEKMKTKESSGGKESPSAMLRRALEGKLSAEDLQKIRESKTGEVQSRSPDESSPTNDRATDAEKGGGASDWAKKLAQQATNNKEKAYKD